MSLDYTSLQAWVLARSVHAELTTEVVTFIRECETLIRAKVEALELRTTLTETDRSAEGIYNLSGRVREVRAAYATSSAGDSYALENVGVAGIRQLLATSDVFHYAIVGQTIEFRGVPATDAEIELVIIGWPEALATTATNDLLTNYENLYTFGTLHYLYNYTQDLELAADAMNEFTATAELLNKLVRRRIGGGSVVPWYNFGQTRVSRGR
jgi:hypothetical protein